MRPAAGFTLIELLVATAIALVVMGALFGLIDPARGVFQAQPEISDMHQRLRSAVDALARDLLMAGTGVPPAASPPLLPYRVGQRNSDVELGVFYRPDVVTVIYLPAPDAAPASRTYHVRPDSATATPQLMQYDGLQSDLPLVDHLVALGFEYFDAGEAPLDPSLLQDGPWLRGDADAAPFDADLLRIRRVRVRLRVEAALAAMRARGGPLFVRSGTSTSAARQAPDLALAFDVALRNTGADP